MVGAIPLADQITLYFDGSCQDNRDVTSESSAGWGVVVVRGDSGLGKGDGEIIEEMSGTVVTSADADGFLGAEVGSNNTGELSGMAHTLRWLLIEGSTDTVTIRGDSKYALHIAKGEWRAKANRELAARVQALWNEVTSLRTVKAEHIRAHRGHRWNERADPVSYTHLTLPTIYSV